MQSVTSHDGTRIAYTKAGTGPGFIIIPGNNRMAHNYEPLAARLANTFTVYVMERRGRGESGPQGKDYALMREVEDVQALIDATQADTVFGHSYGGLVALQSGRIDRRIKKLIAYEPGVSINGSFDLSWLPEFEATYRAGKQVKAMAIFLKKAKTSDIYKWPRPLIRLLALFLLSGKSGKEMRDLMHTTSAEVHAVQDADSDGSEYASITARTLLLGGEHGSEPLLAPIPQLQKIIPHASSMILPGLVHNSPDLGPYDSLVAAIKKFMAA